jgi:hypothetical protein
MLNVNRCLLSILASLIVISILFAQDPQNRPRTKWDGSFGPIKVNDSSDPASESEIAVFRNQACIIVWKEGFESVYWRKYNKFGIPDGSSRKANESVNAILSFPDVAVGDNDCFAMTWMEDLQGPYDCSPCAGRYWVREFKPDGTPYEQGETQINIVGGDYAEGSPFIASTDTLDFWPHGDAPNVPWGITWQPDEETYQENTHFGGFNWWPIQSVRLDPFSTVNSPIGISATGSDHEFIVFYVMMEDDWSSCRARKVDMNANLVGDPMPFEIPANGFVHWERAVLNDIGQVGVAWVERDGNGSEVWFQGYTFTGDAIIPYGDTKLVQSTDEFVRHVAIAGSGYRFVVAWNQAENGNYNALSDIYVRRMYAGFTSSDVPICVDNDSTTVDIDPSVVMSGNYSYVSWTKAPESNSVGDIYAAKVFLGLEDD